MQLPIIIHKDYTSASYNEAMTGGAVGARPAGNNQEQSGTDSNELTATN